MIKRKILPLLILAGLLVWSLPQKTFAQTNTQDFIVKSFSADYYVSRSADNSSHLKATEVITADFPQIDQNHGLLRAIPETYSGHSLSLNIDEVKYSNEVSAPYTTSHENHNTVLKIGDPNHYVHGEMTYFITYTIDDFASNFSDHDEIYMDVNGDQWQQPIQSVTARIHIDSSLQAKLQTNQACYAGIYGSRDSSRCSITRAADTAGTGTLISTTASNLQPGETLSYVLSFSEKTFQLSAKVQAEQKRHLLLIIGAAAIIIALPLATLVYMIKRWRKYGRDPKGRGVIIPEYQPPKKLNVLGSSYIYKETLEGKAVSALIIELAIKKYISIHEIKDIKLLRKDNTSYKLKLIKDVSNLSNIEQQVIEMFFDSPTAINTEFVIKDGTSTMSSRFAALKKALGLNLYTLGYFSSDPNVVATKYYVTASVLVAVGVFLTFTGVLAIVGIPILLSGLIIAVFAKAMPARSQLGVQTRDYLLGLKEYIKMAEAERLKFSQSPEGAEKIKETGVNPEDSSLKVKLFEDLLPYAMIFGLEKEWAKQFKDIYSKPPDWYTGNWGTFNAVYLTSSLTSFSDTSSVVFAGPQSSSGSGFSGGAGGGGGGGGGGGW